MSEQPKAYDNLIKQIKQYNITDDDVIIKNEKINENYKSIYRDLLPDEGKEVGCKEAINIGNKDVYALSDIEGYNIDFLDFLKKLGLVEYTTEKQNNMDGWKQCQSLPSKNPYDSNSITVYYKFNKEKCRNFGGVIVLCGDYVRNARDVSEGTVRILEELRLLLNFDEKGVGCGTEDKKKLFLLAGNHDVANYSPEKKNYFIHGDNPIDLKTKVLQLGLYPQLLLVNGDGKKLLFQHTNFPYREKNNYIVNKKIDPFKAISLLNDKKAHDKHMLHEDGFFNLRYKIPEGALKPQYQDVNSSKTLKREIYSDYGIGYNAKIIGHDSNFAGIGYRQGQGGNIYNVNICNRNEPHYFVCKSAKKAERKHMIYANIVKYLITQITKEILLKQGFLDKQSMKNIENKALLNLYSILQKNNIGH